MLPNLVFVLDLNKGVSVRILTKFGHGNGLHWLGFGAQDLTSLGLGLVKEDGFIPSVKKTELWALENLGRKVCVLICAALRYFGSREVKNAWK
jgi:hypothetical protein